jgi:hypothetical protein
MVVLFTEVICLAEKFDRHEVTQENPDSFHFLSQCGTLDMAMCTYYAVRLHKMFLFRRLPGVL